ncbi:MAG: biopolymer transporter ExbD [Candidatus Marinimicrobia bacterium]|nr:biopolymer transporter ExbD [Candidatus Neomarinimicrobiota bacterium]
MYIKPRRGLGSFSSASMADIAFLLLVFFLVTTTISMDKGIQMVLPEPGDTDIEIPKGNISEIFINQTGKVLFNDKPVLIRDIAREAESRINKRGFTPEGEQIMIFSVKPHQDTKYDVYLQVLDQLKIAGAKKISIANPEAF